MASSISAARRLFHWLDMDVMGGAAIFALGAATFYQARAEGRRPLLGARPAPMAACADSTALVTREHARTLARDGYVVIPCALSGAQLDAARSAVARLGLGDAFESNRQAHSTRCTVACILELMSPIVVAHIFMSSLP